NSELDQPNQGFQPKASMPGARVFSALSGVLFQFQPCCLAGVWAVELRACFSLIRIVKMEICLFLASCCILQESEQGIWKGRSAVGRGTGGRVQGTVFCCLFAFAKHDTSSFPFGPLGTRRPRAFQHRQARFLCSVFCPSYP
ncbi:mCG1031082, partial [Mus musculus]